MNAQNWPDYRIFSIFIVGPEYITVLSYYRSFEDVVEAIICKANDENKPLVPFVVLSSTTCSNGDADKLKEYDLPTLILE